MKKVTTFFRIKHGNGWMSEQGTNGRYSFDTFEDALKAAEDIKYNPNNYAGTMPEESKEYWRKQRFEIEKVTEEVEVLQIID